MTGFSKKYGKACGNLVQIAVIVAFSVFVAPKIILLFMPFIIGVFFAWLTEPMVRFLEEKIRIKRKAGSALVIIGVIVGICLFLYYLGDWLVRELIGVLQILPDMWQNLKLEFIGFTKTWSGMFDKLPREVVEKAGEFGETIGSEIGVIVGKLSMPTAESIGDFTGNLPAIVMWLTMCLLSAYFFAAQKDSVVHFFEKRVPISWKHKCKMLKKTTLDVLGGYVKAQFKIEIWIYLLLAAGLLLLGVRHWYFMAIPIAVLDMLPVLGTGTILVPWAIWEILMGEYLQGFGILIVWVVGLLVRQIIQPKMIGDSLGIAPIPTLVLIYVGYKLAGVVGMIVAVPFGILIMAMNEAGFFDNTKKSFWILWNGFQEFCQFAEEESDIIERRNE